MELFNNGLKWFKGNLHTHTTKSDGRKSPEEVIRLYREAGYDFLAITDHRIISGDGFADGLLLLSSVEYDNNNYEHKKAYHITGIAVDGDPGVKCTEPPQEIINAIRQKNGLAVIAHPAWSFLSDRELSNLENYSAIEIWNTVSETHSCRGDSSNQLDILASQGKVPLMLAVDDTHFYEEDLFGGYVMVNSNNLSKEDIRDSLREGRFYCTQGPRIKQITIENGIIHAEASPVREIRFISDSFYCSDRICREKNKTVTEGSYKIKPEDSWVRVECLDTDGKKAWSQYIRV